MKDGKLYTLKIKSKQFYLLFNILISIVNSAKFNDAKKYLKNSGNNNFIKVYFTRKNSSQNILENTSSTMMKLEDKILIFNKNDIIKL